MPQSSSERRIEEHLRLLREQDFYRVYRAEYANLTWVRETIARLEANSRDGDFSDRDLADLRRTRQIMDRVNALIATYDPNQPRDERGRWTAFDAQKAVAYIVKATEGRAPGNQCAHVVMNALRAGGIKFNEDDIPKNPASADRFGPALENAGFEPVPEARSNGGRDAPDSESLKPGDVVIIQHMLGHPDGHMALYGGKQRWYSDFPQRHFWPNQRDYGDAKPAYVVYRHKNTKN